MRFLVVLVAAASVVLAERPKVKGFDSKLLVEISSLPKDYCGDDVYFGLGLMNGSLERCAEYEKIGQNATADEEYEKWKCTNLRLPNSAVFKDGKCSCDWSHKGPLCEKHLSCEPFEKYAGSGCTPVCKNGGTPAIGTKFECTCPVPWDGIFCDRLACFRKSDHLATQRFRNSANGECICKEQFGGKDCETILNCGPNGNLTDSNTCDCNDTWYGEICDRKCPKGLQTCSAFSTSIIFTIFAVLFAQIF